MEREMKVNFEKEEEARRSMFSRIVIDDSISRVTEASEEEEKRAIESSLAPATVLSSSPPKLRNWAGVTHRGMSSLSGEWFPLPEMSLETSLHSTQAPPIPSGSSSGGKSWASQINSPQVWSNPPVSGTKESGPTSSKKGKSKSKGTVLMSNSSSRFANSKR
jgi:hypothetical protein